MNLNSRYFVKICFEMKIITLLTDFTETDGYTGIMKGVIHGIALDVKIIDLSHEIPPRNVLQAALLLGRSAPYFPDGTVHVGVVDPGVGTARRGIAAKFGRQYFVGPDNGLCTIPLKQAAESGTPAQIFSLENPDYKLPTVSRSFHGRDVFAPAAAHIVNGVDIQAFGKTVDDPQLLEIPSPRKIKDGWVGEILYADAFGNLASNIGTEHLAAQEKNCILIKGIEIDGIKNTFGEGRPGELIAMVDSFGDLSVCVVNGSAAEQLGASAGDELRIIST